MKHSTSNTLLAFLIVAGLTTLSRADDRATLAVLRLKADNVRPLDATIVTNMVRNYFVNAGLNRVLDRDNMDKILHEQSLPQSGITAEIDAARLGRLLNVEKIVVGSLTWFNNAYLIEASIIDVPTSTIEHSKTDRCASTDEFDDLAKRVVGALTGATIAPHAVDVVPTPEKPAALADTGTTGMAFYRIALSPSGDSSSLTTGQRTALRFRTIGFSAADYHRFAQSGLSAPDWSAREEKSVVVAGLLGLSPIGSGFFYTNDIGPALFVTLAKAGAIIGMIPFSGKGGEDKNMRWVYPTVLAGATILDITGSMTASHTYNLRLAALTSANSAGRVSAVGSQNIAVTFATTW